MIFKHKKTCSLLMTKIIKNKIGVFYKLDDELMTVKAWNNYTQKFESVIRICKIDNLVELRE